MAKKIRAKGSTVNQSALPPHPGLSAYCKDLDGSPRRWRFDENDLPPGEKLVACFRPVMEQPIALGLSRKTIRTHIDNLWVLEGEIIRDLNETPSLRKRPVEVARHMPPGPVGMKRRGC